MESFPAQEASPIETPPPLKPKKWLKTFLVIMAIVIIISLASTTGFLFYQNQELKKAPTEAPLPSPGTSLTTPSLILSPRTEEEITIIDGNIYRIDPSGKPELLVNKEGSQFKSDSIQGFRDVKVSPDKSKVCFIGWPPAPAPILYYTDLVSNQTIRIGGGENCFWSPDSQKIAYNNYATDISPINVFVYDLSLGQTKNLTENPAQEGQIRYYESPRWIDEKSLFSSFVSLETPEGKTKLEGTSTINASTGEITEQMGFSCQRP